jgi:hypothetical protein
MNGLIFTELAKQKPMTTAGTFLPFAALQHRGSSWGISGHDADVARLYRMTQRRHVPERNCSSVKKRISTAMTSRQVATTAIDPTLGSVADG